MKKFVNEGTAGRSIVGDYADDIVKMLLKLYADEWNAYYQYWVGAKVMDGFSRNSIAEELVVHSEEEEKHAGWLADRIIQIGDGMLIALSPSKWEQFANCKYISPENTKGKIASILEQNIKGEQCAIKGYNELIKFSKDKDPVTHRLAIRILEEELEHEDELQSILGKFEMLEEHSGIAWLKEHNQI